MTSKRNNFHRKTLYLQRYINCGGFTSVQLYLVCSRLFYQLDCKYRDLLSI